MRTAHLLAASAVIVGAGFNGVHGADEYGSMYINQALVHYIRPEYKRHGVSVIVVPGLNLSSYIFVTTPDGRTGWAQLFAESGYDVYVINDPDFDFSRGFSVSPFTVPGSGAPPADPTAQQGWQQDVWPRWGFGSSQGNPYPDTRFPTAYFANFQSNYPYVSSAGRSYSGAIIALLDLVGPSLLLGHSAGGPQVVTAAKARTNLVTGFIMIEPTGPPDAGDFPTLAGMSMIGVYGDYIDSRNQASRKAGTEAAATLFNQNGGVGEVISLPDDLGIHGNTHLMMQDNNNAFIAGLIVDWLAAHVDTKVIPLPISIRPDGAQLKLSSPVNGFWQTSTNFTTWTNLSPVQSKEIMVSPARPAEFFRQQN